MRHYHEKRAGSIIVFSAVIFAFASFPSPLAAQQPGKGDPLSAAERMRQRQTKLNTQMETALMISALERESRRRPVEEDHLRLDYVQLKEDFWRLQTVNNQMMLTTFSNNVLDYKRISEASSEIRKRAVRLKSNLLLPESRKDEQAPIEIKGRTELDEGEVKTALLALDDLIMTFVNNPIFQHPEVVDVQQSAKAGRDLDAIIKLSAKIKKSAGKLVKNASR